ncbi:MAG TPA: VCBS repeat-containing protein [Pyrinomonadaceae bacterium]|jgi:hypothetical protein|nr:VCBS repeat-containing protein [Pyrinomonadaceae bacterium]
MNIPLFALLIFVALSLSCGTQSSRAGGAGISTLAVGKSPGTVVIADLNRDGKLDLAVANLESDDLTILLGDGKGGFAPAKNSPFPAGHAPNDISVADLNEDGKPDLAIANHDTKYVTILLGDGQGGFAPAANSPVTVQSNPHPHGIAIADFNGDHHPDFVIESWMDNKVLVVFGDGTGKFATPGQMFDVGQMPYVKVRASDVNNDGNADIITTNFRGRNVTVLLGDGKGGFTPAAGSPFQVQKRPFFADISDLNGDGKPDIAVASYSGQGTDPSEDGVTVLLGDGKGGFRPMSGSPFPTTGRSSGSLALGDINGDRLQDIAIANGSTHNVTVLLGNNRGTFQTGATIEVGREPYRIAVGDLNGDGKADIVTANNADNNITVALSK